MFDAISKLVESGVIGEDTKKSIEEAWDSKVKENKEQVTAELREEFAKRYEHDKSNMIEAIDKMMTDKLGEEINKFVEDRKQLAVEKMNYKSKMGDHSKKMEAFVLDRLTNEVKELHNDRKSVGENFAKLEEFVVNALAKEIKEFSEDKKSVVETKVKLVKEAKAQLAKLKEAFIKKSAKVVENAVTKKLGEEIAQLKEDISSAREINFGKRIFEAFASEYQASYLNEKSETSKLMKVVDETTLKLKDAEKSIDEAKAVIESKNAEISRQKDLMERKATMAELLKPLSKDKAEVMSQLLESTQTDRLKSAYEKYLPAVMEDAPVSKMKKIISESSGNKADTRQTRDDADLSSIRVLAGLQQVNN
jgi:predicted component of type VI protein secretion system